MPNTIEPQHDFSIQSAVGARHLNNEDVVLSPKDAKLIFSGKSVQQLGDRLWSSHRILAKRFSQTPQPTGGTTASTTIVHKNTFITATISDTVLFAAAWNTNDEFIGVKQLSRLHSIESESEAARIQTAGVQYTFPKDDLIEKYANNPEARAEAKLTYGPVVYTKNESGKNVLFSLFTLNNGVLSVPRAIGDDDFKPAVVADANIDVHTISSLLKHFNVKAFGTLLLIKTSDGFTDAAVMNQRSYEDFLSSLLRRMSFNKTNEEKIAAYLLMCATKASDDDVTVFIKAIIKKNKRTDFNGVFGVYDGHGGCNAATFVMKNLFVVLDELLALSDKEYADHPESAIQNSSDFDRDNANCYCDVLQEEAEEKEALRQSAQMYSRVRFMLQLALVALVGVGVASGTKIAIIEKLLSQLFSFDKNNCYIPSSFSFLNMMCANNTTSAVTNELLDPTAFKY